MTHASDLALEAAVLFLAALLTALTVVLKRALSPIIEAVRTPDPRSPHSSSRTVLDATDEIAVSLGTLRDELDSLRTEIRVMSDRQDRSDKWMSLVDSRLAGVAADQGRIISRLGVVEEAAAAAHTRIDRIIQSNRHAGPI